MTTTRRRLLIGTVIASVLIAMVIAWTIWRAPAASEPVRAYERIRLGMTLDEVTQAIGTPPGNYSDNSPATISTRMLGTHYIRQSGIPLTRVAGALLPSTSNPGSINHSWIWDDYWIWVTFDDMGKAVGYYLVAVGRMSSPTLLDRVREFVGL